MSNIADAPLSRHLLQRLHVVLVLLRATVLTGCQTPHVERLARTQGHERCVLDAPVQEVLVGVALSGGGSRAALYSAGALEALPSLLQTRDTLLPAAFEDLQADRCRVPLAVP